MIRYLIHQGWNYGHPPLSASLLASAGAVVDTVRRMVPTSKAAPDASGGAGKALDALEQYSRRNCLLIHGLPECEGEVAVNNVLSFFDTKIGIKLPLYSIDRAHRLGRRNRDHKRPRPVIVKFVSYADRDMVWKSKKRLRGSGFLITESLTSYRKRVLDEAKRMFDRENVWISDGRIMVLGSDGTKHKSNTLQDLQLYVLRAQNQIT
ncbi:hypothetical protein J437_LFUL005884 [Ladona fulva]|uniref:Uncharacterized protein n=1 Tax=Ladona fulva TaxID=123851 RepID=A0A8K0P283_LADFU|nr:hypothetical protein J437_LFUL005884 [Ladona fulva]